MSVYAYEWGRRLTIKFNATPNDELTKAKILYMEAQSMEELELLTTLVYILQQGGCISGQPFDRAFVNLEYHRPDKT